jgi:hypothetical protein
LECADLSALWSSGDLSQRAVMECKLVEAYGRTGVEDGGDRSPLTKAVTGYRTPKFFLLASSSMQEVRHLVTQPRVLMQKLWHLFARTRVYTKTLA